MGTYKPHERVCAKTLYRYIDKGLMSLNNMDLWLKLQRNTKPKRNRERKRILGQSIDVRPQEINIGQPLVTGRSIRSLGRKTKTNPLY
ncbi:MAG: integrase catalytic [Erysipelotrichaceae bacterium]|nr:MAG: integrase catalytic [Erysipelotrichaceae bacterium]